MDSHRWPCRRLIRSEQASGPGAATSAHRRVPARLGGQHGGGRQRRAILQHAGALPAGGMPRMMIAYQPMEVIVTPMTTHVHIGFFNEHRRIYTDGRRWPETIKPTFSGYSIGRWLDEDGDGRFDLLEIETRGLKGPRIFDPS